MKPQGWAIIYSDWYFLKKRLGHKHTVEVRQRQGGDGHLKPSTVALVHPSSAVVLTLDL